MAIPLTPPAQTGSPLDERFIELVYSDDELMRAEFDDIVAAEWTVPPPADRTCAATADGRATGGDRRRPPRRSRAGSRAPFPVSSDLVFARSPPAASPSPSPRLDRMTPS